MALSHEEQKRLEELEALLAQDDPKLAHALRGTRPSPVGGKRALISGGGFVLGIALLVAGMQWHWTISVGGFLVMLAAGAYLISGRRDSIDSSSSPGDFSVIRPSNGRTGDHGRSPRVGNQGGEFMGKLEDRWRRRQQGDL